MKIGRNQRCPCGSGKKYKKCCGNRNHTPAAYRPVTSDQILRTQEAMEQIRIEQQGRGKPIISTEWQNQRFVAVGNTLYHSPRWKVFPDFLSDYIKGLLGRDWGNSELKKPLDHRHPILQWYDACARRMARGEKETGNILAIRATGAINCFLGLAYSLYLIKHNVALQERLVKRLKDPSNFQGAYYELIVANCLIRAGFGLTLEDESDESTKHCEFAALSRQTNQKYWVEAKMKSVSGLLGKTDRDGSKQRDPASAVTFHLKKALEKPASDKRLIFIDVNAKTLPEQWTEQVYERLQMSERDSKPADSSYVFVTNIPYHCYLEDENCPGGMLGYGYGIPDFGKRDTTTLVEAYKRKKKHIDAHCIGEAFSTYPQIPTTFDGSLPSELEKKGSRRVQIGQRYFFEDVGPTGMIGKVTTATISESEKRAYYGVTADDGTSHILKAEISDEELEDYRAHKDAYFGVILRAPREVKTPFEAFEWMVESYQKSTKEKLLEFAKNAPDIERLSNLPQEELVLEICERLFSNMNFGAAPDGKV